jgi:hypothetical protein
MLYNSQGSLWQETDFCHQWHVQINIPLIHPASWWTQIAHQFWFWAVIKLWHKTCTWNNIQKITWRYWQEWNNCMEVHIWNIELRNEILNFDNFMQQTLPECNKRYKFHILLSSAMVCEIKWGRDCPIFDQSTSAL